MTVKVKETPIPGTPGEPVRRRRQRAEARQSIAAIMDAAVETLRDRTDASMDDIARAAGVSRQTVYTHFSSREALLAAVLERAIAEAASAIDPTGLDALPPAQALSRLLDSGWRVAARYPVLWHLPPVAEDEDADRHAPVLDPLSAIIRRGQETGDFDATLPASYLLSAMLALGRTAEDEVRAGRMSAEDASRAVHHSVLRLLGVPPGSLAASPPAGLPGEGRRCRVAVGGDRAVQDRGRGRRLQERREPRDLRGDGRGVRGERLGCGQLLDDQQRAVIVARRGVH